MMGFRERQRSTRSLPASLGSEADPISDPTTELQRLRDRLSIAGSSAHIGIWEFDFQTEQLWLSDGMASLYGVGTDELSWEAFVSMVHPDDLSAPIERPTPSFPFGEMNEFLIRVRHTDGDYRTIRSRSTTFGDADGNPQRKVGAHIDMSDDALLSMNAELQRVNTRLRHFTRLVSHDLRSPLQVVATLLDVVAHDSESTLSAAARTVVDTARRRVGTMDRLVVDMLDFASNTADEVSLTDVGAGIEEIATSVDPCGCDIFRSCSIEGSVRVAQVPLMVVVRSLVDNACKHSGGNGGNVVVQATQLDGWVSVVIDDDGPGIDPADHERIFEPFFTTDSKSHSGLGLANVSKIVGEHNASLTLKSSPGFGSQFDLRWPITAEV